MMEVSTTLASIVCLCLFISAGVILYLVLTLRSVRAEKSELQSALARMEQDYRLLRAATPYPYTPEEVDDGRS